MPATETPTLSKPPHAATPHPIVQAPDDVDRSSPLWRDCFIASTQAAIQHSYDGAIRQRAPWNYGKPGVLESIEKDATTRADVAFRLAVKAGIPTGGSQRRRPIPSGSAADE